MYYVVDPSSGNKYGPADLMTLNQWAGENRLSPTSMLEEAATGNRMMASQLPGIQFPSAPAPVAEAPAPSPVSSETPGQSPYTAPTGAPSSMEGPNPYGSSSPYQRYQPTDAGNSEFTWSWVCFALGLLCCPVIFNIVGLVLANNAKKKGHPSGQAPFIANIVGLVLGVAGTIFYLIFLGAAFSQVQ